MSINMTDITFHLDETLEHEQREAVRDELLAQGASWPLPPRTKHLTC